MERYLDEHERENKTITDAIITIVGIGDSTKHFNDMDSAVRDNNNQRVYTNSTKQQHRLENKLEHML